MLTLLITKKEGMQCLCFKLKHTIKRDIFMFPVAILEHVEALRCSNVAIWIILKAFKPYFRGVKNDIHSF